MIMTITLLEMMVKQWWLGLGNVGGGDCETITAYDLVCKNAPGSDDVDDEGNIHSLTWPNKFTK